MTAQDILQKARGQVILVQSVLPYALHWICVQVVRAVLWAVRIGLDLSVAMAAALETLGLIKQATA